MSRNCSPFRSTWVHPRIFSEVRVAWSLVVCVCFVDRCLSFWSLLCLFFIDLQILITSLWYPQTLLITSCIERNVWLEYLLVTQFMFNQNTCIHNISTISINISFPKSGSVCPKHFWLKYLCYAKIVNVHVYTCEGYRFYLDWSACVKLR